MGEVFDFQSYRNARKVEKMLPNGFLTLEPTKWDFKCYNKDQFNSEKEFYQAMYKTMLEIARFFIDEITKLDGDEGRVLFLVCLSNNGKFTYWESNSIYDNLEGIEWVKNNLKFFTESYLDPVIQELQVGEPSNAE